MRNVSDKSCTENQNTHFVSNKIIPKIVYEIKWESTAELGRPQMTIWPMRIACWIPKATNIHTHTICVILIAFPVQQCLLDLASILRMNWPDCYKAHAKFSENLSVSKWTGGMH